MKRRKSLISVGQRITYWREHFGYSQSDLAKALRINPSSVHRWETGRHAPRNAHLEQICAFLRIPLGDFYAEIQIQKAS